MQNRSIVSNLYTGISRRARRFFSGNTKGTGLNWFKEKYLKHASAGVVRSYSYKQKKIYYSSPSEFLHTLKEIFIHEIYKVPLQPNAFIIDCGANIGLSTLYLKEQCPSAEIIAFEPDDKNYELLTRNIDSFGLSKVTARKEAVWIADTQINFSNDGNMGSKIETRGGGNTQTVKAIRLKDLLTRKVDFLKIDIEGAEYTVLKDIAPELKNVDNLFAEYHGRFDQASELTEIFTIIQQAGFHYYIKEAANVYPSPFEAKQAAHHPLYDVQLNIFCFR